MIVERAVSSGVCVIEVASVERTLRVRSFESLILVILTFEFYVLRFAVMSDDMFGLFEDIG